MGDIYRSINRITKTDVHMKAYHESRYDLISEVMAEGINEVSYNKGKRQCSYDKSHNSSNFRKQYNSSPHISYQSNLHSHHTPTKVKCYYCDGDHQTDRCEKFKKDRDMYNLNRADITKYKERLLKNAKKSNISINGAALSSRPQESTYSIEQAEQLIGGRLLSDTGYDCD